MTTAAKRYGLELPERELACAPLKSDVGRSYLGAMRCGINCALANRQILMHLVREVFEEIVPRATIRLLYDVSHNTCQEEEHRTNGKVKRLFVHRKGATRAIGAGDKRLPTEYRSVGQPVLIGGTIHDPHRKQYSPQPVRHLARHVADRAIRRLCQRRYRQDVRTKSET